MIAEHRGRIVKTSGDGLLVEFASTVDAAHCAIEVQGGMASTQMLSFPPPDTRIDFRLGVHGRYRRRRQRYLRRWRQYRRAPRRNSPENPGSVYIFG